MGKNNETYTQKEFKRNKRIFLIIKFVIGVTYLWISYLFLLMVQRTSFSIFGIIIASIICFVAFKVIQSQEKQNRKDITKNNNTWGIGSEAESIVGKSLSQLTQEYKVIEDLNTGHGNIDYIVIGPTGILTIEVKATKGSISYSNEQLCINGSPLERDYLGQAEAERYWVFRELNQHFSRQYNVTGLLEFPYSHINKSTIKGPVRENIWIGEGSFHHYLIKNSRNYLSQEEINNIYTFLSSKKQSSNPSSLGG